MTRHIQPEQDTDFTEGFLDELCRIAERLDRRELDRMVGRMELLQAEHGRLFVAGVGGGAGNATHAVCDLRGMAGVEAYSATDNAATLTAVTNDHGWRHSLSRWLSDNRPGPRDVLLVFSVGGGSEDPPVSENVVEVVRTAVECGCTVCGVVGPVGGETARLADICLRVPVSATEHTTTHTEIYQAVVWHLLATHPRIRRTVPMWESLSRTSRDTL